MRTRAESRHSNLGRLDGRKDLQSSQRSPLLGQRGCGERSPALLKCLRIRRIALWLGLVVLSAGIASAQSYGQAPGDLLDQYRTLRPAWFSAVTTAASRLFGLLALIEFAWTAAVLLMERTDLQGWTAGLIKRMMFVGAFYALLVNGQTWIPAIIDSFQLIGRNAAGLPVGLSPGDVFLRGLDITSSLCSTASATGFFSNPAGAFALVLAGLIIFLSFVVVSIHFIMAMVESYIVVGAGFLFLGFGGSRWTAPYVERYIALAVAVGVKIMVLYLLIGGGMSLSSGWAARAGAIASSTNPLLEALDIVGGAVIFMALCWQAPKFAASLLGGAPAFSGGDVAAIGFAGAQTAFIAGSLGAGAAKLMAAHGSGGAVTSVAQAASIGTGGGPSASGGSSMGPSGGSGGPKGGGSSPNGLTPRSRGFSNGQVSSSLGGQPAPPQSASNGASNHTDAGQTKPPKWASADSASTESRAPAPPTLAHTPSPRTAEIAERLEGQFNRAAQDVGRLRQAVPSEGQASAPANLSLNNSDE